MVGINPDDVNVAVIDIAMPDENGLSFLSACVYKNRNFAPLFLAFMSANLCAKRAGCRCQRVFNQTCGPEELVQAVRSVGLGGHYLVPMRFGLYAAAGNPPRRWKSHPTRT